MRNGDHSADRDVRMRGFAHRHTAAQALSWLDAQLYTLDAERVSLGHASGRVLAAAVISDVDVPGFDRATMDGFAVVAESTDGASAYLRLPLTVIGDAAHAGLPFGAQGANQAIESAACLTACLVRGAGDVPSSLRAYERARRSRLADVADAVGRNAADHHLPDGSEQRARDLLMPQRSQLARQAWLYDYDAADAYHAVAVSHESTAPVGSAR